MAKYCQWLLKSVAMKAKAAGGKQEKDLLVVNIVRCPPSPPSISFSLADLPYNFSRINGTMDQELLSPWPT